MRLDVDEFSRRYLQHVAPKGFHLVRGYGLYRRGGHTEALAQRVRQTLPVALTSDIRTHHMLNPRPARTTCHARRASSRLLPIHHPDTDAVRTPQTPRSPTSQP